MRLTLVGLNLLALAALLGAAWLVFESTQESNPVPETGQYVLAAIFATGAVMSLAAVAQFSGKRRMHAWGAITPLVIGFLLLGAGFAWLVANAMMPR